MFKLIFLMCISFACFSANAYFPLSCLEAHNELRDKHGVPPLELDVEIQETAQAWAEYLARIDRLLPRPNSQYGENAWALAPVNTTTGERPVRAWYSYVKYYDWNNPRLGKSAPFSQVVWKNSERLGCAMARNAKTIYVVAYYDPRGNIKGEFQNNVPKNVTIDGNSPSFENSCLKAHNKYRDIHGVLPMVLDAEIQGSAQAWAEYLARIGQSKARPNSKYGENLWTIAPAESTAADRPVRAWYSAIKYYDWDNPGLGKSAPFSQVVWKNSERLGCAMARNGTKIYVVANYDPRGNIEGEFQNNVRKKIIINDNSPSFENSCLEAHNKYRDMHGVPPLVLDAAIQGPAQAWAEYLAKIDKLKPRPNYQYGENAWALAPVNTTTADRPVGKWYSYFKYYDWNNPRLGKSAPFSQVVWKNSERLGCAMARNGTTIYVVAYYDPHGNINGEFQNNVPKNVTIDANSPSFENSCLEAHNLRRAMHGVPPLVLDAEIQGPAQAWAEYLARTGSLNWRPNSKYGENLWTIASVKNITGDKPVRGWYSYEKYYNWENPGPCKSASFSQVVWKNSERLGCAMARKGTKIYVVANYDPRGNIEGEFQNNVPKRISINVKSSSFDNSREAYNQYGSMHGASPLDLDAEIQGLVQACAEGEFQNNVPKKITIEANPSSFENSCLEAHNQHRAKHGVPPLVLDAEIQGSAQAWAEYLARTGNLNWRPNSKYGENQWTIAPAQNTTGDKPVRGWYSTIKFYDWKNPGLGKSASFSQVVWKKSERLGCAMARNGTKIYVVATYDPRGNIEGEFKKNVPKKIKDANSSSFENSCLKAHNQHRAEHGVPPLVLDAEIQGSAQAWAEYLARTGNLNWRPNSKYGENLWTIAPAQNTTGDKPVTGWYSTIKFYDWKNPGLGKSAPFSQVVWKKSERLGCAMARNGTTIYVVAYYDPPGNIKCEFQSNVPKKLPENGKPQKLA